MTLEVCPPWDQPMASRIAYTVPCAWLGGVLHRSRQT